MILGVKKLENDPLQLSTEEYIILCLGLTVSEKDLDLPSIYWTPKKHKNPTGKRFIIASKHCSTKMISRAVSLVFKLVYRQVENFHSKAKFLSNYNKFWVLQNCDRLRFSQSNQ